MKCWKYNNIAGTAETHIPYLFFHIFTTGISCILNTAQNGKSLRQKMQRQSFFHNKVECEALN